MYSHRQEMQSQQESYKWTDGKLKFLIITKQSPITLNVNKTEQESLFKSFIQMYFPGLFWRYRSFPGAAVDVQLMTHHVSTTPGLPWFFTCRQVWLKGENSKVRNYLSVTSLNTNAKVKEPSLSPAMDPGIFVVSSIQLKHFISVGFCGLQCSYILPTWC